MKTLLTAVFVAMVVFSLTLALPWAVLQSDTGVPNETRRQALIKTSANMQEAEKPLEQIYQTKDVLMILKSLNSLDFVDFNAAIDYIVSQQNITTGGFSDDFFIYGELNTPFTVLDTLESINSSRTLNSNLVDFVMSRYNETVGAFYEPTFERNGEKIAMCDFAMTWKGWGDRNYYAESNIISTFLAVDILDSLNELDRINVTRTKAFVLSCRAENGGFAPFPKSYTSTYGSTFVPWLANYFTVDSYGAGVAYTYCAVGALSDLGSLDSLTEQERQQTIDYVLSCQHNRSGCFVSVPEYASDPGPSPQDHDSFFTYYAVMALQYINAINQTRQQILKAENWFLANQNPDTGLVYELSPIAGAYYFVMCMNASDSFYLLDVLTPRALAQRTLFFSISSVAGITTFTIAIVTPSIKKRFKMTKQNHEDYASQELATA